MKLKNFRFKLLFLVLTAVLAGCQKSEFFLIFDMAEDVTDNFDATYYATAKDGGLTVQAVASVMKGKCELRGVTTLPTLIYITAKKSTVPLVVYATKGDKIEITGDNNQPLSWNVGGNDINKELTEWRLDALEQLKSGEAKKINEKVSNFIENHTDNPVSLILLLTYYNRKENENEYVKLLNLLSGVDNKESWIRLASRADQLKVTSFNPASIESLVMRSQHGHADTFMFKGKNPGFLVFWQNDIKEKKEIVDSLKILLKQYSDSSTRIIADINLDTDSIVWKNAIKRDSLKNISRLWAPAGFADQAVMRLQVSGLPYYIVVDKNGKQVYRGADFKEAKTNFGKLVSK